MAHQFGRLGGLGGRKVCIYNTISQTKGSFGTIGEGSQMEAVAAYGLNVDIGSHKLGIILPTLISGKHAAVFSYECLAIKYQIGR